MCSNTTWKQCSSNTR
ncbi:hypothetical protein LINPERPRIM_LOCUS9447 [Linum perenne]